jgi:hypothetical protein
LNENGKSAAPKRGAAQKVVTVVSVAVVAAGLAVTGVAVAFERLRRVPEAAREDLSGRKADPHPGEKRVYKHSDFPSMDDPGGGR